MRIASLLPSSTEMVCALGLESSLVGRTHECDFPAGVQRVPVLTAPKFATGGSSADIDRRVKALLEQALAVYRVDAEALAAVRPDVIVTQTQCDVCAVSLQDVEAAVCQLVATRPRIVALEPNRLADLYADLTRLAAALGVEPRGRDLCTALQERVAALAARAHGAAGRPTVGCIEWIDPLMAAGNWMPELVELAGGTNLFGQAGLHSPWMSWSELAAGDPEVIVVLPCGFDMARTSAELHLLTGRPEWPGLRAVRAGRVFLADGNQYFNRPGPRLVESLEILAELLHPELFEPRHADRGWRRVAAG